MATLTYEQLVKIGACSQREIFKRRFGDFIEITPDKAEQLALQFDCRLSILRLLTHDQLRKWSKRMHEAKDRFTGQTDPEYLRYRTRAAVEIYCEAQDGHR